MRVLCLVVKRETLPVIRYQLREERDTLKTVNEGATGFLHTTVLR